MSPMKALQTVRVIRAFDLIAPDGQVHQFSNLTWLQRGYIRLQVFAEPAILSAIILGLIYIAGVLAEPLASLSSNSCADQTGFRPNLLL